ncbi:MULTISPECIES: 2-amino-4-hydroxy-6-hydroxymethyldihydropteridine diphosphokinase [Novacetimonas]|uniref:2-amino-4-hydroxy-6-hydroxymethyldihydropteridine pyrophosphokinase n=2 Tax=Novacetimonas hansenii TaxID=436 RepID=A0AAW5EQH7_NOVHA|nr:2-amino-4-hydroxy-6-hydroxymethyldihydropteridine diphosphokinase [Novacetimonas hansenii]EFG85109.1 2-amino-4-hydroxy-6-hydroxymethyldihydropteridine pyrophosphokinase [Novacetimonas hansenii ATCC 23769]MBL7237332.1 2-amino-4-hydroxy-6-hydroxymethyldihydropteridine diphosphokinase [Novacetimonas hansenii]MCJ8353406.1 2-amino-4-hydroxy-6-hydroxymethyldihydropteridine diphosphokinase [Novacetimonas hansenii]PYD73507.1 2-amino-4-hydroxy-6-hydroxymethyldihydropteridine diphosphokinase [Novaceti
MDTHDTVPGSGGHSADILVAVGANLPRHTGEGPLQTCHWAVAEIGRIDTIRVEAVSHWYESAPVPPSGQPPYVNGMVRLGGDITPQALLSALQAIEARAGRVRTIANAARPLDLDIIAMGDLVRAAPDPIVPHPRACLRAFVLRPLRDVAPHWRDPVSGEGIEALLARVADQAITRLPG